MIQSVLHHAYFNILFFCFICLIKQQAIMLFSFFQVVRCLRLLKKFDPNEFQPKSTVSNYKFGKKGQATDQVLELPLENCIYDMISAEGTKGITLVEVLLGNLTLVQLCGIICF